MSLDPDAYVVIAYFVDAVQNHGGVYVGCHYSRNQLVIEQPSGRSATQSRWPAILISPAKYVDPELAAYPK